MALPRRMAALLDRGGCCQGHRRLSPRAAGLAHLDRRDRREKRHRGAAALARLGFRARSRRSPERPEAASTLGGTKAGGRASRMRDQASPFAAWLTQVVARMLDALVRCLHRGLGRCRRSHGRTGVGVGMPCRRGCRRGPGSTRRGRTRPTARPMAVVLAWRILLRLTWRARHVPPDRQANTHSLRFPAQVPQPGCAAPRFAAAPFAAGGLNRRGEGG